MYAITTTGYRAIVDASETQAGEVAVDTIPAPLLATLEAADQRRQRDAMLSACDWTQIADAPLDAAQKAAWSAYRKALRDVPAQPGFPTIITWPISP